MILYWLQKQRICWWKSCGDGRRAWNWRVWECKHWKEEGHEVSVEQKPERTGCGFKKPSFKIFVLFTERVLVAILLCALRVTDRFIKDAVASQVDWGTMLISIAGDVLFRKCVEKEWDWARCEGGMCAKIMLSWWHIFGSGGGVEESTRARMKCVWAEFKELSLILTARCASYQIDAEIYRACV